MYFSYSVVTRYALFHHLMKTKSFLWTFQKLHSLICDKWDLQMIIFFIFSVTFDKTHAFAAFDNWDPPADNNFSILLWTTSSGPGKEMQIHSTLLNTFGCLCWRLGQVCGESGTLWGLWVALIARVPLRPQHAADNDTGLIQSLISGQLGRSQYFRLPGPEHNKDTPTVDWLSTWSDV